MINMINMKKKRNSKNFKKKRKSQGLPINILVLIIIGLILFGMSLVIFKKFANASENRVSNLEKQVKNNIEGLECGNNKFICSPVFTLKEGKTYTGKIFVSNIGNTKSSFTIKIKKPNVNYYLEKGLITITKKNCGTLKLSFPPFTESIKSGKSGSTIILIDASQVSNSCTFTTIAEVLDNNKAVGKTPIIVNVEN